jgi:hypothetical protein
MDTRAFLVTYLVRLPTTGLLDRNNFRLARQRDSGAGGKAMSALPLRGDELFFAAFCRTVSGAMCSGLTFRFSRKRLPWL